MHLKKWKSRTLSLLLALITVLSLGVPALAADEPTDIKSSLAEGSTSVTIAKGTNLNVLKKSTGGTIGGSAWTYTSNGGVTGPAFCINWGLDMVSPSKRLEITGRYDRSPKTMGAFANGYPQRTLEQFKELHPDIPGIENLTETEYAYATQIAIWATCGQLAVPGTAFDEGRASLVEPTSDAQEIRVYQSVVEILRLANGWTKQLYTGLYFHMEEDRLGSVIEINNEDGLARAAAENQNGLRKETINGKDYYTRTMYVDSATSTWIHDHVILVYSMDAPAGTIFTDIHNNVLNTRSQWGATMYEVPSGTSKRTTLNANGVAYGGAFKLCIPCDNVTDSGSISLKAHASVAQFNLYIADNPDATEQSYIIADPAYTGIFADATFKWNKTEEDPTYATLQIQKVDGSAMPLEGAEFTLMGSKGTTRTGISDHSGMIVWTDLLADETYVLSETKAPAGFTIVAPRNISLTGGEVAHVVIQDDTEKHFYIKKIDKQSGATLQGAVFQFEQIDGDYKTTGTTGFDGMIEFAGDELPYGSYRVFEIDAPEGYELDTSVQTVDWDGTRDIILTFQNVREPTIIVSKVDGITGISLPGATFNIYKDGELIDTATTNDAGEFRFPVVAGEGYYEIEETIAPTGYQLDSTRHGIYVNPYDPQTQDDPVLTIENYNNPSLRIIKIDKVSGDRMPGITFEVYKDGELFDTLETDGQGEIVLYDLEPGTYLVQEVRTDDGHVLNSTPQQIELKAGEQRTQTLVFVNQQKPGIYLIKVDSQTMKSIPNVRFEFKKVGGSYTQEFVTDANGEIDISKLDPGAYEVRELEAPEGYLIDDAVRVVQVNPDENASFVFTNTKKPDLLLVKYDPNTGKYLAGATFRIAKIEDGTHYLDRVTDINGRVELKGLEPGVYSVIELEAPAGYVKNETEFHVELFPGRESQLVVNNEAKPNLKIIKTDADSGEPVPGVTFTIKFADGRTVTTEATDENGEVYLEDMDPGVYEIWEQSVPDNYIISKEHQHITLVPNQTHTVQFQNHQRPTLVIKKVDLNGKLLPGAIFEVKTKDGVKIGDFPVEANGTVTISNVHLDEGYYIITEIQAPEGYILDKTPHEVYLRPGKTTEISIENEKKPDLTIIKIDSVTGNGIKGAKFEIYVSKDKTEDGTYQKLDSNFYYTDANGVIYLDNLDTGWYKIVEVEPAAGYSMKEPTEQVIYVDNDKAVEVTFENTPLNAIVVEKYDSVTGAALQGATFQLRYMGDASGTGGTAIGQKVTDKNGIAMWTGLQPGTYVLEEVDPADGYSIIQSSETIFLADSGEQSVVTVRFENLPDGILLIRKVCSVNPSVTLQDAEFKVMYADGTLIGDSNGIFRTDENGEIRIEGLMPGKSVVVTETKAPDGFIIDTQSQTAQIKEGRTVSLTFKNQPKGGIILQKRDSISGQPLSGAQFRITTAAGCEVGLNGVIGTATLTQNGIFTTDSNGEIRISNLAPGTYVVTEVQAPSGYVMDAPSTNVVIGPNGDTQTVAITNTPKGNLVVTKYDSVTRQPLSGAQFKITTAGGEFVAGNEGQTSSNGIYTTDANGQIVLSKLQPGTYIVTETKAPDNYRLDSKPQTVVVPAGDTQSISFYNDPLCTLTILKRDAVTKKPLAKAEFTVRDSEGRDIGKYSTGTDGTATVTGLTPGATYVVSESRAPTGYIKDETPKNIVVRSGVANNLTFDNESATTLIIQKFIDGTDNEPLAGVAFKVVDSNGGAVGPDDGVYYTDKAGEIVLEGLEPGTTVTAKEIKTVDGFVLDGTPQDILIKAGEVQRLTFWNQRAGTLIIEKLDSITKTPLAGAQFKVVYADGRVVDTEGGKLSSNGIYITDANGQIKITSVTGTIVVTEEKAPDGYVMDVGNKSQTVVVNPNDTQTLRFYNEPLCSLTITKLDSITGKPVPGTVFTVKYSNGSIFGNYTTGKDGTVTVTGLIPGSTVVVTESRVPSGYVLDPTPQTILVKNGPNSAVIGGVGGSSGNSGNTGTGTVTGGGNDLTFENDPTTTLIIHKYIEGTDNEPLAGVAFKIVEGSGTPVGSGDGVFYTDKAGEISISGIEPGTTVTVREIKTVDGFVLDGTPKTIKVKAGQAAELTFWNARAGELVILKKDKVTGEPLVGVEFQLTYAGGGYVDDLGGKLSSNGLYTTDANGEIRISGVTGTIVVKETRTIPGYIIDPGTQTQTVMVNPNDTQTLTFYNSPTQTLTIQKYVDGTTDPIQGVTFLVTDSSGAVLGASNGEYVTDRNGRIVITGLTPGVTITARETKTVDGYVLDTTPQSILIKEGEAQTLTFFNKSEGGLELIKINEDDKTQRIPNVTFEIRRMDGGLVETVTTNKNGRVFVNLDAGNYYAVEIETADGFKLDNTPHYFEVVDGKTTTLTVTNKPFSGIIIHKIDSVTGEGIYEVKFLLYDTNKNPIGEYVTDNEGYIYIDDIASEGKGRFYIRELEAAEGYVLDKEYKTVYIQPGETIEIEWENVPITGQIQLYKYAAEANNITGTPAGTPLQGAVYEIVHERSGKVVDYITTDARGVAASRPLPLGRYKIVEVSAPAYWQLDPTVHDVTLEFAGQIIKISAYDKPSDLGVSITKRGNASVLAGSSMRYDFTVANTSNVALESFYWHDKIPYDIARATTLTTGTYSARLNYRILYKTNYSSSYQVLASNLLTSNDYSFSLNAIPVQAGEVVTDVYFDFGKVPVGFQSIQNPTLSVVVNGNAANGYQMINRADVGGKYQGTWQTAQASWVTIIQKLWNTPDLPKTGY